MTLGELKAYRRELKRALMTVAGNPAASASVSAGGGSKTYSNRDVEALRAEIDHIDERIAAVQGSAGLGLSINYPRWC